MTKFDLKIRSRDIETLLREIQKYQENPDLELVRKAYEYSEKSHRDQVRLSGEPYIIHPLEISIILARLHQDTTTIAAALLHDVVEDTGITLDLLTKEFGEEIANLVDGVTKISSIKNKSKAIAQAETLRKMLIATVHDVRVIIIKLADKLHNMRTIIFQAPHKQERIAKETMEIYAPIAKRLGMSMISTELEDLSFQILHPEEYKKISGFLASRKNDLENYIEKVRSLIKKEMNKIDVSIEIKGRAKHYYSIYKKMTIQDKGFDEIYDIRAIRIITDEIKDCYAILGTIHTLWSPIAARFKDYIAVPKSNMYQSLHTTVIGPEGHPLEVQIRTKEMDETAEIGIAAHWLYKEQRQLNKKETDELEILSNINKLYSEPNNTRDFMTGLKMELYEDEIFVFTPRGKIIKLAKGATPVDFAFAIHSEVGLHTTGSKINNKMVPLRTKIKSGDIVEILTSPKGHPSETWLKFVKSSKARNKIRSWIRKNIIKPQNEEKEKKKKEKETKTASVMIPDEEQKRINKLSAENRKGLSIEGSSNVLIRLSQCCQPIPGDNVIGFITRGRGITVHKKTCPSLKRLQDEKERFIDIVWESKDSDRYPIKLAVRGTDRPNLLKDIADEISLCDTNILKMEAGVKGEADAYFKFIMEVKNNDHLKDIIKKIMKIDNISDAYKLNEKVVLK